MLLCNRFFHPKDLLALGRGLNRGERMYFMCPAHGNRQQGEPLQSQDAAYVSTQFAKNAAEHRRNRAARLRVHPLSESGQSAASCVTTAKGPGTVPYGNYPL